MPPIARLSILGFVGGALAVLIFHQSLWFLFNHIGLIPPERPAWPLDPIPPFGVPSVISKAFWGGVWGAVLAPLLSRWRGGAYWAGWIIVAAIALPLVAFFVVPPIKGRARSGALAAFPRLDDGQRRLGIRNRALPAARGCAKERLRWRRNLPSAGRKT